MYLVILGQGERRKEREIDQGDNFVCHNKLLNAKISFYIEEGTK